LSNASSVNAFVLRIAWSVLLWNPKKIEIARTLAEVINRNIGNPDRCICQELKVKDIGFSDYND
jgi:hypothetical protein